NAVWRGSAFLHSNPYKSQDHHSNDDYKIASSTSQYSNSSIMRGFLCHTKTSTPTLPAHETCPEGAVREHEVGSTTFQTDVPVLEGGEMRT
ncbi:hypothetical protein WOLCODRAFT_24201, partial [Wolfiporia cocos MD-104 SS10]